VSFALYIAYYIVLRDWLVTFSSIDGQMFFIMN